MSIKGPRSFEFGRAHIPTNAAAFCCLCRESFASVDAYNVHRDMTLAPSVRQCLSKADAHALLRRVRTSN